MYCLTNGISVMTPKFHNSSQCDTLNFNHKIQTIPINNTFLKKKDTLCNEPAKRQWLGRSSTFMAQWFGRWTRDPGSIPARSVIPWTMIKHGRLISGAHYMDSLHMKQCYLKQMGNCSCDKSRNISPILADMVKIKTLMFRKHLAL